jgi:hypothetical protein
MMRQIFSTVWIIRLICPPGPPLVPPPGSATDAATFFTRLNPNVLVYASGEVQGDALLAKTVILVQRLSE